MSYIKISLMTVLLLPVSAQGFTEGEWVLWEKQTEVNHALSLKRTNWTIRSAYSDTVRCQVGAKRFAEGHLAREQKRWGDDPHVDIVNDELTISIKIHVPEESIDISSESTFACFLENIDPRISSDTD